MNRISTQKPTRENVLEHVRIVGKISDSEKERFRYLQTVHDAMYEDYLKELLTEECIPDLPFNEYIKERYGVNHPYTVIFIDGFEILGKDKYLLFCLKYPH